MDAISAGLQSAGVALGFGKSFFKDEARLFGLDGRKLTRICLISSVGFLATDQTREAIRTKNPVQVNGAAILWTITGRSILLATLRNQTERGKRLLCFVSDGAFVTGTGLSIFGQLADAGSVAILPTALSTTGLWFGCQMDRQDKQENANRLLLGAGVCMFGFGCVSGALGIMAKTFLVDISATSLNTYRNYVRDRYDGSIPQKIAAYAKDTAHEAFAWWG
jgi:hypothetical protein